MNKFREELNTAVLTTRDIIDDSISINFVSHDLDDGGWQFLPADFSGDLSQAVIVGLGEILGKDKSLDELGDLPAGWIAYRKSDKTPWIREKRG